MIDKPRVSAENTSDASERPKEFSDTDLKILIGLGYIIYIVVLPIVWIWALPKLAFVVPVFFIALFPPIFVSMMVLRKDHGAEIYVIWLIFFLVTYIGLAAYYYLDLNNFIDGRYFDPSRMHEFQNGGTLEAAIYWFISISTDIEGELVFILSLVGLVTIPQLLSFMIGGLVGCAKQPALVATVSNFAILNLIKFLCVFSGLEMSAYIFRSYRHIDYKALDRTNISDHIFSATLLLSACFVMTAIYYKSSKLLKYLLSRHPSSRLSHLWRHMTRFTS